VARHMHHRSGMQPRQPSALCRQFAKLLGATPAVINGVCTATNARTNLVPKVLGRKAGSFMYVPQAYSYENMDRQGRALCLGETVILQSELQPYISRLRRHGIKVTAVHNHWLFDSPRLMYIHYETIANPLDFAKKVRDANRVLTSRNIRG